MQAFNPILAFTSVVHINSGTLRTGHLRLSSRRPSLAQRHIRTPRLTLQPPSTSRTKSSPSQTPNNPRPLPKSSQTALNASFATLASAVGFPLALAVLSSLHADTTLAQQLSHYASHFQIVLYTILFATLHSGLASLRPRITPFLGERLYRVIFALASLPSAVFLISIFIAHRYDGMQLWRIQGLPFVHETVFVLTFISFLFLYPATFNLPQVAAISKPQLTLFTEGVIRITRHPQLTGQVLWCLSHTAWVGTSYTVTASLSLIAHHLFAVWNGDRRLRDRYGEMWFEYEKATSVLPFGKGWQVRWDEFGWGYLGVVAFIVGAYMAHPAVLRAVGDLNI